MPCYTRLIDSKSSSYVALETVKTIFVDLKHEPNEAIQQQLYDQFKIVFVEGLGWVAKNAFIAWVTGHWDFAKNIYSRPNRFIDVNDELESLPWINTVTQKPDSAPAPRFPSDKMPAEMLKQFLRSFCLSVDPYGWYIYNDTCISMRQMWEKGKTRAMVFYTFINRSRFSFRRTDQFVTRGEFTGSFETLPMALATDEGDLVSYGHISSSDSGTQGAASAVQFHSFAGPTEKRAGFTSFYVVVAGACLGDQNTLEVRIDQSGAESLAKFITFSNQGQNSFQQTVQRGQNVPVSIKATVEKISGPNCHVVVEIN